MNKFVAWTACALLAFGRAAGPVVAQEAKPEEEKEEPQTAVDASKGGVTFKSGTTASVSVPASGPAGPARTARITTRTRSVRARERRTPSRAASTPRACA